MKTKKCPNCSNKFNTSAKFCPECGTKIGELKSGDIAPKKLAGSPIKETLIVVAVVVAISLGYFVFAKQQPVPKPQSQSIPGHENMGEMGASMPELPQDYDGLVAAGDQAMNQNNFPIAAECYKRALAIDGSSPDVRSDFGSCLYGMGLADRALDEFRTVKENFPMHGISLFNLGVVFLGQDISDSARYYFAEYLELEPNGKAAEQARNYLKDLGI